MQNKAKLSNAKLYFKNFIQEEELFQMYWNWTIVLDSQPKFYHSITQWLMEVQNTHSTSYSGRKEHQQYFKTHIYSFPVPWSEFPFRCSYWTERKLDCSAHMIFTVYSSSYKPLYLYIKKPSKTIDERDEILYLGSENLCVKAAVILTNIF